MYHESRDLDVGTSGSGYLGLPRCGSVDQKCRVVDNFVHGTEAASARPMTRVLGLAAVTAYASLIAWLYVAQPQTVDQVTGGLAASVGAYRIDQQAFDDGLAFFRHDQFMEARAAVGRADSAERDATVQFYTAYSYYREGWGRFYNDDLLFQKGRDAVDRAIALAPNHRLIVSDPNLDMHSADELRGELTRGMTRDWSDINPLRVFRARR